MTNRRIAPDSVGDTERRCRLAAAFAAPSLPFTMRMGDGDPSAIVSRNETEVVVHRARSRNEIEQAFGLIYRVYVEERGLIDPTKLPSAQRERQQKWDAYDFAPTTQHVVAVDAGRVVGTMRLIDDVGGMVPLDRNGFSLAHERVLGCHVREVSKLIVEPTYRSQGVSDALFWLAWSICRADGVRQIFLSCDLALVPLYRRKLSGQVIGRFLNEEFGKEYAVMRVAIAPTFAELAHPRTSIADSARELATLVTGRSGLTDVVADAKVLRGSGGASTRSVQRVHGTARDAGRQIRWSAVVKEISPTGTSTTVGDAVSWRREALAYSSGALSTLPSSLAAPTCHLAEATAGNIRLVISDLGDIDSVGWTRNDFVTAAQCLGRFNGAYLTERAVPAGEWKSRNWLRTYLDEAAAGFEILKRALDHPLVSRAYPDNLAKHVLDLWSNRLELLDLLDRLPHGFAHLDAARRNLFQRRDETGQAQLVAIDWANAGLAPPGQELAALILGSTMMFDLDTAHLEEIENDALGAYCDGLRDAGWNGNADIVRFAYAASSALRYTAYGAVRIPVLLNESMHSWAEAALGKPLTDIVDRFAIVCQHSLRLAEHARELRRIVAGSRPPASRHARHHYLMEHSDEGQRLEAKTDARTVQRQLRLAGLKPGMRALDVGCGTGAVTRVMARITCACASMEPVVGVDRSADRVCEARRLAADTPEVRFVPADAGRLPFDDQSFDFAWSRFLFEYLPDAPRALAEMVRVVKPGGIVSVADLDGQIEQFFPLPATLDAQVQAGLAELRMTGFDPRVGRKLYSWFHDAGLKDIRAHVLPYQAYAGGVPAREWPNWSAKIEVATNVLASRTGDVARWTRVRRQLLEHIRKPNVFYYASLVLVSGRTP